MRGRIDHVSTKRAEEVFQVDARELQPRMRLRLGHFTAPKKMTLVVSHTPTSLTIDRSDDRDWTRLVAVANITWTTLWGRQQHTLYFPATSNVVRVTVDPMADDSDLGLGIQTVQQPVRILVPVPPDNAPLWQHVVATAGVWRRGLLLPALLEDATTKRIHVHRIPCSAVCSDDRTTIICEQCGADTPFQTAEAFVAHLLPPAIREQPRAILASQMDMDTLLQLVCVYTGFNQHR